MKKRITTILIVTAILALLPSCGTETSSTAASSPSPFMETADVAAVPSTGPEHEPSAVPITESETEPDVSTLPYREKLLSTLWYSLSEYFDNPYAVAGIIGNMGRESRLCPWRYEGDESENYVDSKIRTNLVNEDLNLPTNSSRYYFTYFGLRFDERTGFGLCQWTALGYKYQLYEMAVETGRDIDDPELQIDFLIMTLKRDKSMLIDLMEESDSSLDCVQLFISLYEKGLTGPADLLRRHEIAECVLAMFAPEYASEEFRNMSTEEMLELMDIPEPPTEEQLYEQS